MAWQPDPLLLELFETVEKELANALEVAQRRRDTGTDLPAELIRDQTNKVASLRVAIAALEGALERRQSRLVH